MYQQSPPHPSMAEDHEALFRSFPCEDYYVQSPSTASQVNSPDCRHHSSPYLSGHFPLEAFAPPPIASNPCPEASRFVLSNYSSSRGSNNSFVDEKKTGYDLQSHDITRSGCNMEDVDHGLLMKATGKTPILEDDDDEIEFNGSSRRSSRGIIKVFSFGYPSAWYCIVFQFVWKFVVSMGLALLVFFLFTRPPPPKMSVKVAGVREFVLGEGVDNSGVATKILACNCSIDLEVDNRSKFFGLHIRPPVMDIAFGRLTFATTQGEELYVAGDSSVTFRLNIGTKKRAMYGAGRAMEDMLQSGQGLPLLIQTRLRSSVRVVWNLIRPRFGHRADCLLVLKNRYDRRHRTQVYNSTCTTTFYT